MDPFKKSLQKKDAGNRTAVNLCLTIEADLVQYFSQLLGNGFKTKIQAGYSIKDYLCHQLGLSAEYLEKRIQTIFLDGKAVDEPETAIIDPGATLALSGAMPGLAGATLRCGGPLKEMRGEISHGQASRSVSGRKGQVKVKLFNLILKDLGPVFLKKGILIEGKEFHHFIAGQTNHFRKGCHAVEVDGIATDIDTLINKRWEGIDVFLQVRDLNK